MEYRVSSFHGQTRQLNELIAKLSNEVTINVRAGATLVGGVSICSMECENSWVCVSQAYTIQKDIVDNLI